MSKVNNDKCIEFIDITKKFPGQYALRGITFNVKKGEIHSILGENGAGKSTLLNVLHGVVGQTSGEIKIDGETVDFFDAHDAIKYGIAKVHQEISIVPEMRVYENVMLGAELTKSGFLDKKEMIKQTQAILETLKSNFKATDKVATLSAAQKQMIQVAKALQMKAKIVSFDEPTSSLSKNEEETLFEIIKDLKQKGITILYISHKLDEIFRICDRTTVLRDGKYVGSYDISEITKEKLIQNMVGRDVNSFAVRHKPSRVVKDKIVLEVKNLKGSTGFKEVSFNLKKGEILGFFGLVGAGRTEVMRAIFGADPIHEGDIYLHNRKIHRSSPSKSIKNGLGLLPENRKEQGFVKYLNNADNIALASIKKYEKFKFVNKKKKYDNAINIGKVVKLMPNDPDFITTQLSGGNAQKVVVAKWLSTDADIIIFDEPTKGIDIGAKAEIYKLMESIVEQGKSIIMVSSELPEIIGMSDRLEIMREGHIVAELERKEFNEQSILTSALEG
jgi:ribose transport system ATP-binding protein